MNKIEKSKTVPTTLIQYATEAGRKLENLINQGKELDFNKCRSIYAAKDVKAQLKSDQRGKCAYCERYYNGDYGSVEHYRPKGGYQISITNRDFHKPGYYWLTYSWDNLLFSCSE